MKIEQINYHLPVEKELDVYKAFHISM